MIEKRIHVSVQAFAAAAEAMGCRHESIQLAGTSTVGDAWEALKVLHPALAALEKSIAFASNDHLVDRSTPLVDGDAIALLPPVSGG